jgi:cyclophilin family peptidyl-prolyl cis-trans isomerase
MPLFKTNLGSFKIELDEKNAPITTRNFIDYVNSGFFNGTIFHRVINGFMIQGGGFTPDMKQKDTKPPIANESNNGLKNDAYTVAMARTSVPDSATSQFFINVANNDFLNYPAQDGFGYCVFGKVTEGMDTIDKIQNMATGNHPNGHQDVPIEAIIIEEVSV